MRWTLAVTDALLVGIYGAREDAVFGEGERVIDDIANDINVSKFFSPNDGESETNSAKISS